MQGGQQQRQVCVDRFHRVDCQLDVIQAILQDLCDAVAADLAVFDRAVDSELKYATGNRTVRGERAKVTSA